MEPVLPLMGEMDSVQESYVKYYRRSAGVGLWAVWRVRLCSLCLRPSLAQLSLRLSRNRCCVLVPLFLFPPQNVTGLDRVVRAHYCEIQLEVYVWLLLQNIFFSRGKKNEENVIQVDWPQKWKLSETKALKDSCWFLLVNLT